MAIEPLPRDVAWPSLPFAAWRDTCETLHLWTQVVGKIRLAQAPPINHWWQVTLYVTADGLTTSPIPYGETTFQIDFDFQRHLLRIETSAGRRGELPLSPRPVADFYRQTMDCLRDLGIAVRIRTTPSEIENPIPFEQDRQHAAYDPDSAQRFWRVLVQADRVFTEFRSRFLGKVSPVHFFWGACDLAVTRFSGLPAPPHPPIPGVPDFITREGYSHEVSSAGFWPGSEAAPEAIFYSYAYPEPGGFSDAPIRPREARYLKELGEFVLPYEAVRTAASPDAALLDFLQSTYEAAAERAAWNRGALERSA